MARSEFRTPDLNREIRAEIAALAGHFDVGVQVGGQLHIDVSTGLAKSRDWQPSGNLRVRYPPDL
ncbi:MAG: hypothetical protein DMG05_17030 [Acidobacteria bacterium]|nr:MAG: hypothetical protein DMG05_17030 [Acidobacteriota bacterium]